MSRCMSNNSFNYMTGSTEMNYYKYAENKVKYNSPGAV